MRGRLSHRCWKTAMQMRAYTTNDRCWIVGSGWDEMDAQLFILMSDSWGHLSNTQRAGSEGRELPGEPLIMPTLNTIRSSSPLAPVRSRHNRPGGMPVQHAKPDGGNREEVHRGNHFLMVAQKGQPAFTWLAVPRRSFHPAGDRPFRDVQPEHQQFPMDAWRSPSGVLHHHTEDQLPHLLQPRPSPNRSPYSRDQPPIHAKAGPVLAHNRFRSDDDERLLPLRPQPMDSNPEELVKQIDSRPRTTPFQHGQLLSQNEDFEDKIPAATEESKE